MCMTYTCNLDDAYFCTSVNHCTSFAHFVYKLYISPISAMACIHATILMHTSALLLVTLQASYPSGTSFTSYTCLLLLAYVLQSHTTIYQGL
ncbi:uncharacterized protein F5147DRAFT_667371 [Suillus discolor]|uniref:Uncharacterized protein n=1 Tax=Suillus discolor TaxID=1912936 RepID=A0A9P7FIW9_9AGAM|nr:uncharacterized protein F5147DRAFT_667371 [Suillus discolor]KAG2118902.1 hypothetical protein F5147DRAFT_667371 [Suillus discolor]